MSDFRKVIWLEHAIKNLRDREVPLDEAVKTIETPEWREESYRGRIVLMRMFNDPMLDQSMLLRIVIEEELDYITVVTVYKTSNVKRCLKREK